MSKPHKMPDFELEKKLWEKGFTVIGVDEVGRGALAGPVYVGAFCFPIYRSSYEIRKIEAMGICDSKAAGVQKRKKLDTLVRSLSATFAVASSDVSAIDRKGIVEAVRSAVRKSVGEVLKKLQRKPYLPASQRGEPAGRVFTLLDAFPVRYIKGIGLQNQLALIGGDESSLSIAAASIVAKVARDNFMCQIAKKHNNFGWERNKGYGTREHKEALTKFGKTRFHRTDFL